MESFLIGGTPLLTVMFYDRSHGNGVLAIDFAVITGTSLITRNHFLTGVTKRWPLPLPAFQSDTERRPSVKLLGNEAVTITARRLRRRTESKNFILGQTFLYASGNRDDSRFIINVRKNSR